MLHFQEIRSVTTPLGQKQLNDTLRELWNKTKHVDVKDLNTSTKTLIEEKVDGETFTSYVTQTAQEIASKVKTTDYESYKTQTASKISSKVSKIDYTGNTIASLINQTATTIDIKASKINLTGAVTVLSDIAGDLGTITAGTITGATIRTSSSSSRIELSGTTLKAYRSGYKRVQLDYDSLDFYNNSGSYTGTIQAVSAGWTALDISSDDYVDITAKVDYIPGGNLGSDYAQISLNRRGRMITLLTASSSLDIGGGSGIFVGNEFIFYSKVTMPEVRYNEVTWPGRVAMGDLTHKLGYVSSSERFKLAIEEVDVDPYKILELKPKSWYDKNNTEKYAELLTKQEDGEEVEFNVENIERIGGLIAEDADRVGLGLYVNYEDDGRVQGIDYDRIWTLLIPIVKDHEETIQKLLNKIKKLEGGI